MIFWLGTHMPRWLATVAVPLFVSHRRLAARKTLPRATGAWALDSGAFSELSLFGAFHTSAADYAKAVRRYRDEIGELAWAAIQDWMCEPFMLARTGLTVAAHQTRTCDSYAALLDRASDLPWVPVIQGYHLDEYRRHVDDYDRRNLPVHDRLVGVGSVCRRQALDEVRAIVKTLRVQCGLRLHGFGIKTLGVQRLAPFLDSADSMAWSYAARREPPLPGHSHRSCANCLPFALAWRAHLLTHVSPQQALPWN